MAKLPEIVLPVAATLNVQPAPSLPHNEWLLTAESLSQVRLDDSPARARSREGIFEDARPRVTVDEALAVITIRGVLSPDGDYRGGTSTRALRAEFARLQADPSVRVVLTDMITPGGTVAGMAETADDFAALSAVKPTLVHSADLLASGGMWLASQAREISAGRTAWIGSIGTLLVVYDWSRLISEDLKIDTHVFATGPYKGTGVLGSKLTEPQQKYLQERVEQLQTHFSAAVMSGRRIAAESLNTVADGRVFSAAEAQAAGLIDRVETFRAAYARGRELARQPVPGKSSPRSAATTGPSAATTPKEKSMEPATYQELIAACPGLDPKAADDAVFLAAQQAAAATAADAAKAWTLELKARAEKARAEAQTARDAAAQAQAEAQQAKTAQTQRPGAAPLLGTGEKAAGSGLSPQAEFAQLVRTQEQQGMDRRQAITWVAANHPELHQQMLAAANPRKTVV